MATVRAWPSDRLYRDRVTVQVRTETSDGHDGYTESWSTRYHRWASQAVALRGRDLEIARQVDPRVTWEVSWPYWEAFRADLDGGRARLVLHPSDASTDDLTLEIVAPPVDVGAARDRVMVLCREVA